MKRMAVWHGVVILLAAALLRLPTLGVRSVWLDEAYSVWQAEKSQTAIWITDGDEGHPPLYYSFLHGWLGLGRDEMLIRLPSALVSLLGVALVWQLGRRVAGEPVGLLAAAFLAVSPLDVWYAQEARMYTPLMVVGLAWAVGLVGTWENLWELRGTRGNSGELAHSPTLFAPQRKFCHSLTLSPCHLVILAFGLYLDFPMVVLWGGLSGVWLMIWWQRGRDSRLFRRWLLISLGGWLLFLPGLGWLMGFALALSRYVPLPPLLWLLGLLVGPLVVGMVAAAFWPHILKNNHLRQMMFGTILMLFVSLTLWVLWPRFYLLKRLVLLGWPYLVLLTVWVLWRINRPQLIAGLWGFTLMIAMVMQFTIPKDDWRGAVAFLNDAAASGDIIWLASGADPLVYDYYEPAYPARVGSVTELQDAAAIDNRIWLITGPVQNQALWGWLEMNRVQRSHVAFYRVHVWLYEQP